MMVALWIAAAVAGALFRQVAGFQQALALLGRRMAEHEGRGLAPISYQNSITPPWVTALWLTVAAVCLASIGATAYLGGLKEAGIGFGVAVVAGVVSSFVVRPSFNSYYNAAFHSLSNRGADFRRRGDVARADAADEFCALMVAVSGPAYAEGPSRTI